ncbi:hypothetical protein K474DRAFT_1665216 [Panus rudis PR-1116 ss-1]|nr:hypothetical protein K474DRAFT_1665216 [Panus rudis PR-1116 ss-1]
MFSAVNRVFQAGANLSSGSLNSSKSQPAPVSITMESDHVVGENRPRSKPPSLKLDRTRPPNISWLPSNSPSGSGTLTPKSFGMFPSGSPRSSPGIEPTTPTRTGGFFPQRKPTSLRRLSSDSLHVRHSAHLSEASDGDSIGSLRKQLSPIDEHQAETIQSSPKRRPSLDSTLPRTPDSASHPAFLTRTLKRSVSQTSTSTFRSNISLSAPSIPPVDLRPTFSTGTLGLPHRKSQLALPTLPTVAGSPRQYVSVIYEDQSSQAARMSTPSFITAASDDDVEDVAEEDENPLKDSVHVSKHSGPSADALDTASITSHHPKPPGFDDDDMYEIDLSDSGINFDNRVPPPKARDYVNPFDDPDGHILQHHLGTAPSAHHPSSLETSSSVTRVEFAIHSRWLKSSKWGSERFTWTEGPKKNLRFTSAFILFWIGFIAPWCWLIGGWYLSPSGEIMPDGQYLQTVDLAWPRKPKTSTTSDQDAEKGHHDEQTEHKLTKIWHPVGTHSQEMLTARLERQAGVSQSETLPPDKEAQSTGRTGIDPWVRRCRIAAIASGFILSLAVIAALVVVAGFAR